jgi:type II secretory pathway pseudopilin PulG
MALLPVVAVPAMLSAIAIPNFVKARSTAQLNSCINNLRQLDAAENQWALEKDKKTGDVCTEDDLKPYIRLVGGQLPKCPQGGTYTIGPVGEQPTCSIPGHKLP